MKYFLILFAFLAFSCSSDDSTSPPGTGTETEDPDPNEDTDSVFTVTVDEVGMNEAAISWTIPTNTNGDVRYKVVLGNEVLIENLSDRHFNFTDLYDSRDYSGTVFSLDSNGNQTFTDFNFRTICDPIAPSGVVLRNQDEVDNFCYNHISSGLKIEGVDIVDLSNLESLEYVGNHIIIQETSLQNLNGLQNVISAYNGPNVKIDINHNSLLTDISGISPYSELADIIFITYNANLNNLDGLNVTTLDVLFLIDLPIENLNAISNLTSVNLLYLLHLSDLNSIDSLINLVSVYEISIGHNPNLIDLNGLSNLTESTFGNSAKVFINNNINLQNLCGIREFMNNVTIYEDEFGRYYEVNGNAYNPTEEEIKTELCAP